MTDAVYDLLRVSAKSMASIVEAHRFLWLCNWSSDVSSKAHLDRLSFKGKLLFGKVLGEGKPAKLPEDKSKGSKSAPSSQGQSKDFHCFRVVCFAPY